jgi:poly(3-hydroxybutyrate) depolymerase
VDTLALRIEHKPMELRDEASPTGHVSIERGESRAVLLTPGEIDPAKRYPLITVLHGAGRQDEMLVKACRDQPEQRDALFLVPRSLLPTWDLIASPERPDLDFLEYAYDLIYRRYPVDAGRQALLGYSDGASYALSVGLSNPHLFRAVMGWAAGFIALDRTFNVDADPRPSVLLEYGTHDELFPFERVAVPMRDNLRKAGYTVEFRVDQGGRHWPSADFLPEALDWFFSEPWEKRS